MRIAILHYHLKPGGVTRVIENTVRALNKAGVDSLVFCSEKPTAKAYPFENVRVIPELAYHDTFNSRRVDQLKQDLESSSKTEWGRLPDIWHVHNHSLAKNLEVPVVVSQWAREGQKLLLQIHDCAEDGRPENYQSLRVSLAGNEGSPLNHTLYPVGDHVHYAFINGRDRSFFSKAGVALEQCHLLANPVWLAVDKQARLEAPDLKDKRLYLYPTRSIRRKNLGELLLWSAAAAEDEVFGSTMAPANPNALPYYERWKTVAKRLKLPMRFGLGEKHSFDALLNSAYAWVTTSIAEGFGLAYLEPYLIGAQLVGRDLPEITRDFLGYGIHLEGLYPRLDVPVAWVGMDLLKSTVHNALVRYYQSYRQPFRKDMTEQALDEIVRGDLVDFGRLDEAMQESVIEKVSNNPSLKLDFAPEKLDRFLSPEEIEENRRVVQQHFNIDAYGETLLAIYSSLLESNASRPDFLDTEAVLKTFLDPRRFYLLRT